MGTNRMKAIWSVKIFIGFKKISEKSDIFPYGTLKTNFTMINFFIFKGRSHKNQRKSLNKERKNLNNSQINKKKENQKRNHLIFTLINGPNQSVIKIFLNGILS